MSQYYERITDWGQFKPSPPVVPKLNQDYNLNNFTNEDWAKLVAFSSGEGYYIDEVKYGHAEIFNSNSKVDVIGIGVSAAFAYRLLTGNKPRFYLNSSLAAVGMSISETRHVLEEQVGKGGKVMDVEGAPFFEVLQSKNDREQIFLRMEEEEGQIHEKAEEINPDQQVTSVPPKIPTDQIPELEVEYVGGQHGDVDDLPNNMGGAGAASGKINPALYAPLKTISSEKLETSESDVSISVSNETENVPPPSYDDLEKLKDNVKGNDLEALFTPSKAMQWEGDKRSGADDKKEGSNGTAGGLLLLGGILGGLWLLAGR